MTWRRRCSSPRPVPPTCTSTGSASVRSDRRRSTSDGSERRDPFPVRTLSLRRAPRRAGQRAGARPPAVHPRGAPRGPGAPRQLRVRRAGAGGDEGPRRGALGRHLRAGDLHPQGGGLHLEPAGDERQRRGDLLRFHPRLRLPAPRGDLVRRGGERLGMSLDGGVTWKNWTGRELGPEYQYTIPDGIVTRGDTVYIATADGVMVTWDDG